MVEIQKELIDAKSESFKSTISLLVKSQPNTIYKGALLSTFSVSATKKVVFSQGNLQYRRGGEHLTAEGTKQSGTWRFAEHQYDVVGGIDAKQKVQGQQNYIGGNIYYEGEKCDNIHSLDESYEGWFDLFGYGTSGWNSGKEIYKPGQLVDGKDATQYQKYISSIVGENRYADWGVYNAITNGGNTPELWRVLSSAEWIYLLSARTDAQEKFGTCTIHLDTPTPDGVEEMYGIVLLPDDWSGCPDGITFNHTATWSSTNNSYTYTGYFSMNEYTEAQWAAMESYGAIYIPGNTGCLKFKADYKEAYSPVRDDDAVVTNTVFENNTMGIYFTSTVGSTTCSYGQFEFDLTKLTARYKDWAMSVRLVTDIEDF